MENNDIILQEKIRAFANGELQEPERLALLEQANTDPELADELAFSLRLATALQNPELLAAKTAISRIIDEEGFPPPAAAPKPVWKTWWVWLGAGLLSLVLITGTYWALSLRPAAPDMAQLLSRQLRQPLENVLFLPDSGEGLRDLKTGMEAYDARRYADAARSLRAYVATRNENAARVYLGVSHLMAGQPGEAVAVLSVAAQSQEPPVQEAALWYLALAQLEQSNPRSARQTLSLIPPDGLFGEQAQELLKKLE